MSIRQRLYPTAAQAEVMTLHCAHSRFVWNLALEQFNCWRRDKHVRGDLSAVKIGNTTRMQQLTQARQHEPWLASGSSSVQQGALRDFDTAIKNWWAGTHARPTWRKAALHNGFVVRDLSVERLSKKWAQVTIPKAGKVRFRLTRTWAEAQAATSARVTLDRAGRWHLALVCPPQPLARAATGAVVGIDRGVANTLALSDGRMLHAPGLTPGEQARFLVLQQRLARQQKGSARRDRTRRSLARLHARLADRRRDWIEQTTTMLVREHDLIAIEDLRTKNMVRRPAPKPDPEQPGVWLPNNARAKASLNRAIYASCWGAIEQRLTTKAALTHAGPAGVILVKVDPRNTSRKCASCGHTAAENRESQAVFVCQSCGHTAHADTNAAITVLDRGLAQAGTTAPRTQQQRGRTSRARTQKPPVNRGSVNHLEEALT